MGVAAKTPQQFAVAVKRDFSVLTRIAATIFSAPPGRSAEHMT
jgi:hypothetical protein